MEELGSISPSPLTKYWKPHSVPLFHLKPTPCYIFLMKGSVSSCHFFPLQHTRFRLTLGLSIGIFGLLVIISVIIVCCCCCICCDWNIHTTQNGTGTESRHYADKWPSFLVKSKYFYMCGFLTLLLLFTPNLVFIKSLSCTCVHVCYCWIKSFVCVYLRTVQLLNKEHVNLPVEREPMYACVHMCI